MQDVFLMRSGVETKRVTSKPEPIVGEAFLNMATIKTFREKVTPSEGLNDLFIVVLLLIFISLYAFAFAGKLDPFNDNSMLLRFEPIIFILVGYYFGRLPIRHGERFFREEIARQAQRADAAQFAKEKAQQERDSLEERIRNARRALTAVGSGRESEQLRAVTAATRILDS